jgi:hypothetical protein
MQSLTRYLAAADASPRNLLPMQPIEADVDDVTADRAMLALPDSSRVALDIQHNDASPSNRPHVRYDLTARPGRYELRWRGTAGEHLLHFVVRAPAEESDLTPLTPAAWEKLRGLIGFTLADAGTIGAGANRSDATDRDNAASEAWPLALAGLAVMLLVESILGRAWSATGREAAVAAA